MKFRTLMVWLLLTLGALLPGALSAQVLATPTSAKPISEQFRLMPVPATLTSPGKPGDIAFNSATDTLYVYTGTGRVPHVWETVSGGGGGGGGPTRSDLAGGTTLDLGSHYYDSISTGRSISFSGTPAEGSSTSVLLIVTNSPTLTIPSSRRVGSPVSTSITTLPLSNGVHVLSWTYSNGNYYLTDTVAGPQPARVLTIVSSATPTINTDAYDCVAITAQAAAVTSFTTNLSGSPQPFDQLEIRIKDDGTTRALTWGASFASRGATLPTATIANKVTRVWLEWNFEASTWDCVGTATEA